MEVRQPKKVCFVTIGATAAFDALIKAVLDERFQQALEGHGYTELRLQYGKTGASMLQAYYNRNLDCENFTERRVLVKGFSFKEDGLQKDMVAAREGVVISHAGR